MTISQYDAYKKLFPYLLVYITLFQFFFMMKVQRELSLNVDPYLFSGLTAIATLVIIGGALYLVGKIQKSKLQEKKLSTVWDWLSRIVLPIGFVVVYLIIVYIRFKRLS